MTRQELINKLYDLKEQLLELETDEVTDYARENAYICINSAIDHLEENYSPEDDE